jgi:hypothetical protein
MLTVIPLTASRKGYGNRNAASRAVQKHLSEKRPDCCPESSSKSSTKSFETIQKENACTKKKKMLKSEPVTKDQPHDGPGRPNLDAHKICRVFITVFLI